MGMTVSAAPTHRYTGKERDTESDNDYFGARYYNSATGRWLSPDWSVKIMPVPYAKLDNPQSLNLYAYVLNNPLSHVDLDGHTCASLSDPKCSTSEHKGMEDKAANSPYRLTVKEDYTDNTGRNVTYQVKKLDDKGNLHSLGKDDPTFHVTEHQTVHVEGTTNFGAGDNRSNDAQKPTPNRFEDNIRPGIGQTTFNTEQSFTISTSPSLNPSDSQPILVRIPGSAAPGQTDDHGVMDIHIQQSGVTINGTDKLTEPQ